jgi:A/G-specific adenine glycosylase
MSHAVSERLNRKFASLFTTGLLQWNKHINKREMPWKGEKDPYKIWLSEIILQQTRVEQGLKYYLRFIETYPTIAALARAPEQEVFKLWEGLGYYSRCKNLILTAKEICNLHEGIFPVRHETIRQLKGIGDYTAAAIASFAYDEPHAVVDGNVLRVLSRIFDLHEPIDATTGKKRFSDIAQQLLPRKRAAEFNQAIMDFGATICRPMPCCTDCFFQKHCQAFLNGTAPNLPVKQKKTLVRDRYFNYIVLQHQERFALQQRTGEDIWQNLFHFPLVETTKHMSSTVVLHKFMKLQKLAESSLQQLQTSVLSKQRLSHQLIHFQFIKAALHTTTVAGDYLWITASELKLYPLPKGLQTYVQQHF